MNNPELNALNCALAVCAADIRAIDDTSSAVRDMLGSRSPNLAAAPSDIIRLARNLGTHLMQLEIVTAEYNKAAARQRVLTVLERLKECRDILDEVDGLCDNGVSDELDCLRTAQVYLCDSFDIPLKGKDE